MYDRLKGKEDPTPQTAGEQPTQETQQPTEQTSDTAAQEQPQSSPEPAQASEEPTPKKDEGFDVSTVNNYFGSSFKDADEIKSLFEKRSLLSDYETKLADKDKELQGATEKYNALMDSIDPDKLIPDKEIYAVHQLKEKYPGVDAEILTRIRGTDMATLDKLEGLVMIDKLTVPSNISDKVRKEEILKGLGIEEDDVSQLSENDRYRIEREYARQAKSLNEIKEFQPDYGQFDLVGKKKARQEELDKQYTSLKARNEAAVKSILSDYNETKSFYREDGQERSYSYVVDPKFKEENEARIVEAFTNAGYDAEKNKDEVRKQIDLEYWLQAKDKIIHDIVKQTITSQKDAAHDEIHSDSPTNTTEAPATQKQVPQTVRDSIKSGGFKKVVRNY